MPWEWPGLLGCFLYLDTDRSIFIGGSRGTKFGVRATTFWTLLQGGLSFLVYILERVIICHPLQTIQRNISMNCKHRSENILLFYLHTSILVLLVDNFIMINQVCQSNIIASILLHFRTAVKLTDGEMAHSSSVRVLPTLLFSETNGFLLVEVNERRTSLSTFSNVAEIWLSLSGFILNTLVSCGLRTCSSRKIKVSSSRAASYVHNIFSVVLDLLE